MISRQINIEARKASHNTQLCSMIENFFILFFSRMWRNESSSALETLSKTFANFPTRAQALELLTQLPKGALLNTNRPSFFQPILLLRQAACGTKVSSKRKNNFEIE